ncbi:response regulator transcription factor [Streptomyces orinoci]|uniref:Response regulator transcription factor n=1 Tax=Streptomyces orinoci TaxID=67339 RepID=A0ABV3K6D6_STRON|nr:response regulator transcription factor [Streptomyces orinoci]
MKDRPAQRPIRVAVVDDQEIVREGLTALAGLLEGIEVVGDASDGQAALRLVAERSPDVVLMDMRMPVMDGIEATRRITRDHPRVAVLALSTYAEDKLVIEALRAGARGYLTKDAGRAEIAAAVRSAVSGNLTLDARVTRYLVNALSAKGGEDEARQCPPGPDGLTRREVEVLRLVARTLNNAEIAAALFISEATVKTHLNNIYSKTGLQNRADAVRYAITQGLTTD